MYEDDELEEIQNEFKRKQLLTHALGPSISLVAHVVLFLVLFFVVVAQVTTEEEEVVVQMVQEPTEEVIENPEDLDSIEETAMQSSDTSETTAEAEEAPDEVNTDVAEESLDIPQTELLSFTVDTSSPYSTRSLQGKAVQVAKGGGDKKALSTVLSALKWLKKNQKPDGSWGDRHKEGNTGLATLLFLAHGETPSSKHFGKTVQKSLKWLSSSIKKRRMGKHAYGFPIMVYAVSEGYSLTSIPDLKDAMDDGIAYILKAYQKNGSFGYGYKKTGTYDISISGWNFQAIKAAYLAGATHPKLKTAIQEIPNKMIKGCGYKMDGSSEVNAFHYTSPKHKGSNGGVNIYEKSIGLRSVGTLILQLFGEKRKAQPAVKLIIKHDIKSLKWNNKMGWPLYAWYYTTQVLYNNKNRNANAWSKWNSKFQKMLYENQNPDGHWLNFSDGNVKFHAFTSMDNKVYSTALCGLMLTVYYRYLPTTKLLAPKKKKKVTADTEEVELDFL